MAIGAPPLVDGKGEPQPFTHLGVPNADLYRSLLRTFARAKERFIVHLRPEDVAADLRIGADDQPSNLQVANELGCSRTTVALWRRRYLQDRLSGLQDAPRSGRPRCFSPR